MLIKSFLTTPSGATREVQSSLLKDIYICMYAINVMLDAKTIFSLSRSSGLEHGDESFRYTVVGEKLMEIARLILNSKSDLSVSSQAMLRDFSNFIQLNISDNIRTYADSNRGDTYWLERLTADCQLKTFDGLIGVSTTDVPLLSSDIDIYSQIECAILLNKSGFLGALQSQFKVAKSFALRVNNLLLGRAQELKHIPNNESINFYKSIAPYTSLIWIAEGLLSLTPKVAFSSCQDVDVYKSQIRALFPLVQVLGETNEDKNLIANLLEDCLGFAFSEEYLTII